MKPTAAEQRQEVARIFSTCRDLGIPLEQAVLVAVGYFVSHDLNPPVSIRNFLAGTETPAPGSFPEYMN